MVSVIKGVCKVVWYNLRYGRAISFTGIPRFEHGARINLLKGIVRIDRGLIMKPNAYCAIADNGCLTIGRGVSIARNATIVCHDSIIIGDNCSISPNVAIYDHDHCFGRCGIEPGYKTADVTIEKNCWIGTGVIILRGTHIGEGSVIGAGCVVQGDIPAHSLVKTMRELIVTPIADKK